METTVPLCMVVSERCKWCLLRINRHVQTNEWINGEYGVIMKKTEYVFLMVQIRVYTGVYIA